MINQHNVTQIVRYCTVGAANTAVDWLVFGILTLCGMLYMPAQVLAYTSGMVNSFIFNRQWTFAVQGMADLGEVAKFLILNTASLALSAVLLFLFHQEMGLNLWLAKAATTVIIMAFNFLGSRMWVFNKNYVWTGDAL